jgi:hypothetical protein
MAVGVTMWKYSNDGRFIIGIPARDLTDKEVSELPPVDQETVKTGGIWIEQPEEKKEVQSPKKTKENK